MSGCNFFKMDIRSYNHRDKEKVLQILDLNTPAFFDAIERKEFIQYLENEVEDYFVVEENNEIIGAGGINYFPKERKARIAWDMIKPNAQGKGIGRHLTQHRIDHINTKKGFDLIIVRTSQLAFQFYEKLNFKIVKLKKTFGPLDIICI